VAVGGNRLSGTSENWADASAWASLRSAVTDDVQDLFVDQDISFAGLATQAFLILLREGFEAMLVVMALAAYLRRSAAGNSALYAGIALAVMASVFIVYGIRVLFEVSGAAQEALEGVTMLVAAAVLPVCQSLVTGQASGR